MWTCADCGAEVADYLEVCSECGAYRADGALPAVQPAAAPPLDSEQNRVSRHNMAVGACWLAGGALITLFSYRAAAPGGTYVVATGAIGYGLIRLFVGWSNFRR